LGYLGRNNGWRELNERGKVLTMQSASSRPRAHRVGHFAGLTAALLVAHTAFATTVIPPTFDELVAGSREIFVGRVVSRASQWVENRDGRMIVTLVTFAIEASLKGGLQTQTSLEFVGGTVNDMTMTVAGMPQFSVGDRDVLFVGNRNAVSPLIGLMYGRFRVLRDARRGIDTVRMHDGSPLLSTTVLGRAATPALRTTGSLSLSDFQSEILTKIRAQTGGKP
jgi:hypothetical protein